MTDPLSIIAGVLAIATATIQSSKAVFELVGDISKRPKELVAIVQDVQAFYAVLSSLSALLEDEDLQEIISGDRVMLNIIETLTEPIEICRLVLREVTAKIQEQSRPVLNRRIYPIYTSLRWGLCTKGEVRDLQLRLEQAKSTLNSALDSLTAYVRTCITCFMRNTNSSKTVWRTSTCSGKSYKSQSYHMVL